MGDLSAEPSMEEILSSIKRIIAEEGEQPQRRARPARNAPAAPTASEDEVLELREPLPAPRVAAPEVPPVAAPEAPRSFAPEAPTPEPVRVETTPAEPILSQDTAAASRGALETLTRLVVRPEPGSDGTLEGLVREMLRPMLRNWLDANLPAMVETLVQREIKRITSAS